MKNVQSGDEKFMSVLLLVSGQMARVRPYEMEEAVRDVGSSHAGIKLLEESRHLTDQALARDFRHFAHVLVREKVISE